MWDAKNMMCVTNPHHCRQLETYVMFRGNISTKEVDEKMINVKNKKASYFLEWIPKNLNSSIYGIPPSRMTMDSPFIKNSTSIQEMIKRVRD
eukprot:Gb_22735 [translate_table: standard]